MKLPEVRGQLLLIADDPTCPLKLARSIRYLVSEMTRRKAVRRAATRSKKVTPALRVEMRKFAKANPGMPYTDIARYFDVNPGRVSEALAGFRD